LIFSSAVHMHFQFAVLNAFLTSNVMMAQYFLPPYIPPVPTIASAAISTTAFMASTVERFFRKPNWNSDSPPTLSTCSSNRLYIILSRAFPVVSHRQIGRYEEGSPTSPFPFGSSTRCCTFQILGNTPSNRHFSKTLTNMSVLVLIANLNTILGIPSGPGVFLSPNFSQASITSLFVIRGIFGPLVNTLPVFVC
jgi:hypothetical protein